MDPSIYIIAAPSDSAISAYEFIFLFSAPKIMKSASKQKKGVIY
jgi:hypothetical protein